MLHKTYQIDPHVLIIIRIIRLFYPSFDILILTYILFNIIRNVDYYNHNYNQVCVLVFVFLFCWSPYAVMSMGGILGMASSIPVNFTVLPLQLAKSSVVWNPVIYVVMNKQVK